MSMPYGTTTWVITTKSSNIKGFGTKDNGTLVVEFLNGTAYEYPNQAKHMVLMLGSESMGRYFNANLRPQVSKKIQ